MVRDTKPALPQDDELSPPPARMLAEHLISLALRVAMLAFLVTALISLGESL